jgi:hypothetical protein
MVLCKFYYLEKSPTPMRGKTYMPTNSTPTPRRTPPTRVGSGPLVPVGRRVEEGVTEDEEEVRTCLTDDGAKQLATASSTTVRPGPCQRWGG